VNAILMGYPRLSADGQSLDLRLEALRRAVCVRISTDKVSISKADDPRVADAVSHRSQRDILVIWKLDPLGRTANGPVDFVANLHEPL
jgi:DNA invertase Pin-like site-specific DNA recombinase